MKSHVNRNSSLSILSFSSSGSLTRTSSRDKRSRHVSFDSDDDELSLQWLNAARLLERASARRSSSISSTDTSRPRRRATELEKMMIVMNSIKACHWTLKNFLTSLHRQRQHHSMRRAHEQFLDFAYQNLVREKNFEKIIDKQRENVLFLAFEWSRAVKSLSHELESLTRQSMFDAFESSTKLNDVRSLQTLRSVMTALDQQTSLWMSLFEHVAKADALKDEDITEENTCRTWPVLVMTVLSRQRHSRRATNMPIILDLYLYQSEVRRRVLTTLNQLNLMMSYQSLSRRLKELTMKTKRIILIESQRFSIIVIYDNFDFMKDKRDERTSDTQIMRSITTALLFREREFENELLNADMWHLALFSLSTTNLARKICYSDIDQKISCLWIQRAVISSLLNIRYICITWNLS